MGEYAIEIENLVKRFDKLVAVKRVPKEENGDKEG